MLTLFRDLVRSKVALVLIGLLILSLALFGVPDFFGSLMGGQLGNSLMRAESRTLEVDDVERYADRYVSQNRAEGGDITKQQLADDGQLSQIIGLLADFKVRAAYLDKLNITASKEETAKRIADLGIANDEITGKFDQDLYAQFVSQRGYRSKKAFERVFMDDLAFTISNEALATALYPSNGMSDLWTILKNESRNIAFFNISLAQLAEPVKEPTDADVEKFYKESKARLAEPERRQFSVLAVTPEDFYHTIKVSEKDIKDEYEAQTIRFSGAATRTYQLMSFASADDANTALGFLLGGGDPKATKGILSDEISAKKAQIADKKTAEAIFDAPVNFWTGPVITDTGASILVRVTSEKLGDKIPFESVKEVIRQELVESRAKRTFDRVTEDMDDAVGAGTPLEEIATKLGTPILTYPPVDKRGFSKDDVFVRNLVSLDGALSMGFELYPEAYSPRQEGENVHYIIRLDRIVEPSIPELDKIKEPLRAALFARNKSDALTALAKGIQERIEKGEGTITTEALALNVKVTRPPVALTRASAESQGIPQQLLGQIFNTDLDGVFMAPFGEQILLGVVEGISIPDEATREKLRSSSEAELKPSLIGDIENGFADLAQTNVKSQMNQKMIDQYLETYQATE